MKAPLVTILMALTTLGSAEAGEHFACNVRALTSAERARHQELTKTLLSSAQEKEELKNGYAFRLPPTTLINVAEWVSLERRCCPFFTFEIAQTRDQGPVWLRVTGSEGVKAFLRVEFQL
jgi:hypothetical protein